MACRTPISFAVRWPHAPHYLIRDARGYQLCMCDPATGEQCGLHGDWQHTSKAPLMFVSDRGIAAHDEQVYRTHNITHTDVVATEGGGRVRRAPAPKGGGCTCGNCAAHCKRAAVTGVASPGKEL